MLSAIRSTALLLALIGIASCSSAAETEVALTRHQDKSYEISGLFTVDASTSAVWAVLTDYEHIPGFVSSMRSSHIRESRRDGSLLVEQVAVGDMFFLTKKMHVLLEVRLGPERLRFTDVGHDGFRTYDGDWEVRPITLGSGVSYHLLVEPSFLAPSFILSRAMKKGARKLLDQVRAEIVRRELAR